MSAFTTIAPEALNQVHSGNAAITVIDVRSPAEYRSAHVSFATLVPLDTLNSQTIADLVSSRKEPFYIFCQSGTRAKLAAERIAAHAQKEVVVVQGGISAWEAAGLPVVRGKQTISLERQVRIAAGSLVLTGVLLGFFVHRGFFGISAFVGAGLVFAGITDFCGMGLLLARMPWNQVAAENRSA